jgi:hypothetical protein
VAKSIREPSKSDIESDIKSGDETGTMDENSASAHGFPEFMAVRNSKRGCLGIDLERCKAGPRQGHFEGAGRAKALFLRRKRR